MSSAFKKSNKYGDNKSRVGNANLFFQNLEQNNPDRYYKDTEGELYYFKQFIQNSIDSLDVKRYALNWREIKNYDYIIEPYTRIKIIKPEIRIFISINPQDFDPQKQFFDEADHIIKFKAHEKTGDGIYLSLHPDFNLKNGDNLYYGRKGVEWSIVSSARIENIKNLHDSQNNELKVLGETKDLGEYFLLNISQTLKNNEALFLDKQRVDYEVLKCGLSGSNLPDLQDKKGKLNYSNLRQYNQNPVIQTEKEITGFLSDTSGFIYHYRSKNNKKNSGVWIEISEPDIRSDENNQDGEQSSVIDIFLELSSSEGEIWEDPDLSNGKTRDTDKKIRFIKSYSEESRILVERLPKKPVIYPPKATGQLMKQLNAVELLKTYPSPEHRTILDFFEKYENLNWNNSAENYRQNDIEWEYLTDLQREGTKQQQDFVIKALNTPDVAILEGPPGSGKTTAISELICQLLKDNKRILLCASTHVAIDNVIEKMEEHCLSKGTNLMDEGIVPLRIGRNIGVVSERVKKYHIDERIDEFKTITGKIPETCNDQTRTNTADEGRKENPLEEMVIQSSNLVCGTTMGIPSYPHIFNKFRDYIKPEFDYLIIDEASKTTFQEFLVPAVHSKKYILVGDIRQLSPSVDELNVRVNLDGIIDNKAIETALKLHLDLVFAFNKSGENQRTPKFICVEDKAVIEQVYKIFSDKYFETEKKNEGRYNKFRIPNTVVISDSVKINKNSPIDVITSQSFNSEYFRLVLSDLIFIDSHTYRKFYKNLPETHIFIEFSNTELPDVHDYKVCHMMNAIGQRGEFYSYKPQKSHGTDNPFEIKEKIKEEINSSNWAGKIAWRMKRVYELENSIGAGGENSGYYEASMHALLPPDSDSHKKIWNQINKVKRIAFPSVLTSLQVGVSGFNRKDDEKTILSHGIPDAELNSRYEILQYQHRMHPDISKIPRRIYYKNEALLDVSSVIEQSDGGEGGRDWSYDNNGKFRSRFWWRDVAGNDDKNVNRKEIEAVLDELDSFVKWVNSRNNSDPERTWELLIVTFYDAQRKAIMEELRKKGKGNERNYTIFDISGVRVYNYTVDKVQGREADFVILSTVRTRKIGFMDNPNRQNVAITRARYQTLIIGNRCFFGRRQSSREFQMITEQSMPEFDFSRCDKRRGNMR